MCGKFKFPSLSSLPSSDITGPQGTEASKVTGHRMRDTARGSTCSQGPPGPPFPTHSQLKLLALYHTLLCLGWLRPTPHPRPWVTQKGIFREKARQGTEPTHRTTPTRRLTLL